MYKNQINLRFTLLTAFIILAAFSRMVPHMANLSPLAAIGLFGAAHFSKKWQAFLIPVLATWLSDLFLNNVVYASYYPEFTWFYTGFYWQYASYLLITLAGLFMLKKVNLQNIIGGSLASVAIFFMVSNFGSWIGNPAYPQNFNGLMICYLAGIPFIKGTLLGSILYSAILFGSFAFTQKQFPSLTLRPKAISNDHN